MSGGLGTNLVAVEAYQKELKAREVMDAATAALAHRDPHPDDWRAHPGPQTRFLELTCFEALYGGAAGGGKSDCLLADAIRYVGRGYGTGYQALLLRRTFGELEKSLILRSHSLYPRIGGVYNEQKHVWIFPGGERVQFGYMERDADRLQYQGSAFQFVGFDELTHFTLTQYLYLFSRCRPMGVPVRCRIRGATNPGGRGHSWVFERFGTWLNPKHTQAALPGRVRYFIADDDGGDRQVPKGTLDHEGNAALGRTFVPARLEDNPTLMRDPTYRAALTMLDPVTRAQLRHGNWLKAAGKKLYFDRDWVEMVDPSSVPSDLRWVRAWDLASTAVSKESPDPDWTRGVKMARWGDKVVIGDRKSLRGGPGVVEDFVLKTAEEDGKHCTVAIPQDPGSAGKILAAHLQTLLMGYPVEVVRASQDKETRFKPFSGFASPPKKGVCVVKGPWNDSYFDNLEAFTEGGHDDDEDATSDAFNVLADLPPSYVKPSAAAPPLRFGGRGRGF